MSAAGQSQSDVAVQGGGPNYLGEQPTAVDAPINWQSSPEHEPAHLAYITDAEQDLLVNKDMYGSLDGTPNRGPGGIPSLQGDMGGYGGTGGSSGGGGGGDGPPGGGDPGMTYTAPTTPSPHVDRAEPVTYTKPDEPIAESNTDFTSFDTLGSFINQPDVIPTRGPMGDEMWDNTLDNLTSGNVENVDYDDAKALAQNQYVKSVDPYAFEDVKTKNLRESDPFAFEDSKTKSQQETQLQADLAWDKLTDREQEEKEELWDLGQEKLDKTWQEHWASRPDWIKWSPTLSFLWASGQNISEWMKNQGLEPGDPNAMAAAEGGEGGQVTTSSPQNNYTMSQSQTPNYLTTSPAANWFAGMNAPNNQTLGGYSSFNLSSAYASAKAKVAQTLGTASPVGWAAVSNTSPFYNFLHTNSLNKGII